MMPLPVRSDWDFYHGLIKRLKWAGVSLSPEELEVLSGLPPAFHQAFADDQ